MTDTLIATVHENGLPPSKVSRYWLGGRDLAITEHAHLLGEVAEALQIEAWRLRDVVVITRRPLIDCS